MSIPGLGQIPAPHVESTTRIVSLRKACEWRFHLAPGGSISVKLLSGTAEKDGIELAPRGAYKFCGPVHGKLLTWHGCDIEVDGRTEHDTTASFATTIENPAASHLNLHAQLAEMRGVAARFGREGPRVLVAGGRATGKTTLARTLASYATRQGAQPLVVNANPGEGMLSLAGTLSAAVFATVMDPLAADGWGGTPTSGPSTVPVKLPLVYYYGRESAEADPEVYKRLLGRLADGVSAKLSEDPDVKAAGVLVDSMGVDAGSARGLELLAHIVEELSGAWAVGEEWPGWCNIREYSLTAKNSKHCGDSGSERAKCRDYEALCDGKDESGRAGPGHYTGKIRRRGGQGRLIYGAHPRGCH